MMETHNGNSYLKSCRLGFLVMLSLVVVSLFCGSCDRMDTNGKLDGNWQMTQWIDKATRDTIADKNDNYFYTVKLELIQFQKKYTYDLPCMGYFEHKDGQLVLGKVFQHMSNSDSIVTFDYLKRYGVTNDGKFSVDLLTDEHMTLSNKLYVLQFRKY